MFKLKNVLLFVSVFSIGFLSSCGDDDNAPEDKTLNINIAGLQDLGADYMYEGWLIVDGSPISTGLFSVDGNGVLSNTSFDVASDDLDAATKFVVSIEPTQDSDPAPSAVKILGGDFDGSTSNLSIGDGAALGDDLTNASGGYILATPTNGVGDAADERSGVWFLDPSAGPGAGLTLPTLPDGWAYEGWAVVEGTPVSTGVFTSVSGADNGAAYSGTEGGPAYPGEDFLMNAPSGLTFPVDLRDKTIVISIEPQPDNSAAPFVLKPLVGGVPADAEDHTFLNLENNAGATNPTGTVTR